jgi:hypothetical protein
MNKSIESFIFVGIVALASATWAGCSNMSGDAATNDEPGSGDYGSVRLALSTNTTVDIATASYTITGPGGYMHGGTVSATGGVLSGLVGGIPAGTGFSIALSGTSTDSTVTCSGTATFDVVTHQTTEVTVPLLCREMLSGGSVAVTDTTNICPVVDGVAAAPMTAPSGGTISLMGTAHDKDMGPAPLAYQWTTTAGTFDNAAAQNPTFTCPTVTTATSVTVTLTVTDSVCTDSMQLTVTCG